MSINTVPKFYTAAACLRFAQSRAIMAAASALSMRYYRRHNYTALLARAYMSYTQQMNDAAPYYAASLSRRGCTVIDNAPAVDYTVWSW